MTTKLLEVSEKLLVRLLAAYKKPENLIGENGLRKQLFKRPVEKALEAELIKHLVNDPQETAVNTRDNTRNSKSKRNLKGEFSELPVEVPRHIEHTTGLNE